MILSPTPESMLELMLELVLAPLLTSGSLGSGQDIIDANHGRVG